MISLLRNSSFKSQLSSSLRFGWNNYIQRPGEGVARNVTLIPGHGIGPEITCKYIRLHLIKLK